MRRKKLANKIMSILMSATMLISTPISALATDVEVRQNVDQGEVQISSEGVEDLSPFVAEDFAKALFVKGE